jgi:serine/threonine protein kinase
VNIESVDRARARAESAGLRLAHDGGMQQAFNVDLPELLGRYRLARAIKSGGMAEVFEAYLDGDGGFVRRFAIKRPLPGTDLLQLAAFADEARILSQLDHPGIVSVFDYGIERGWPYQVLEYIDGIDLTTLVGIAARNRTDIPIEHALQVIADAAAALHYAHHAVDFEGRALGVVHRDVSPQNIVVSWRGDVKVLDFGIALANHRLALTRAGIIKGKLSFMSPEQLSGQRVTPRGDVFSLGCVLHYLAAGDSPFSGAVRGRPNISAAIDEDVAEIIRTAIACDPCQRHASAHQLALACDAAIARRGGLRAKLAEWLAVLQPPRSTIRSGDVGSAVVCEANLQEEAATVADLDRGQLTVRDTLLLPRRAIRLEEAATEVAAHGMSRAAAFGVGVFACTATMLLTMLLR